MLAVEDAREVILALSEVNASFGGVIVFLIEELANIRDGLRRLRGDRANARQHVGQGIVGQAGCARRRHQVAPHLQPRIDTLLDGLVKGAARLVGLAGGVDEVAQELLEVRALVVPGQPFHVAVIGAPERRPRLPQRPRPIALGGCAANLPGEVAQVAQRRTGDLPSRPLGGIPHGLDRRPDRVAVEDGGVAVRLRLGFGTAALAHRERATLGRMVGQLENLVGRLGVPFLHNPDCRGLLVVEGQRAALVGDDYAVRASGVAAIAALLGRGRGRPVVEGIGALAVRRAAAGGSVATVALIPLPLLLETLVLPPTAPLAPAPPPAEIPIAVLLALALLAALPILPFALLAPPSPLPLLLIEFRLPLALPIGVRAIVGGMLAPPLGALGIAGRLPLVGDLVSLVGQLIETVALALSLGLRPLRTRVGLFLLWVAGWGRLRLGLGLILARRRLRLLLVAKSSRFLGCRPFRLGAGFRLV